MAFDSSNNGRTLVTRECISDPNIGDVSPLSHGDRRL